MKGRFTIPGKTGRRLRRAIAILTLPGLLFALLGIVIGIAYFVLEPTELHVTVAADRPDDVRVIREAVRLMDARSGNLRLRTLLAKDASAAGELLRAGKAQLAVLGSEELSTGDFQTVLVVRTDALVVLARPGGKVKTSADLGSARIAFVRADRLNRVLTETVTFAAKITTARDWVTVDPSRLATVWTDEKVDAVAVAGPASSRELAEFVSNASRNMRDVKIIDLDFATALANAVPWLEKLDIDQGAFGGKPSRPAEDVTTVGVSTHLVTTGRADNDVIADLVRQLIALRGALNSAHPGYGLLKTPDTDDNSTFVIHPGVKAYVNAERTTLFDRYGDWLYLIAIVVSGIGSLIAATYGWYRNQQRQESVRSVLRLETLYDDIPAARDQQALSKIEEEADAIFRGALKRAASGELGGDQILTVQMAMSELRARISSAAQSLSATTASRRVI